MTSTTQPTTEWCKSDIEQALECGDIVEFHRGPFSHFAIYVGAGEVVHKTIDQMQKGSVCQSDSTSCCCGCYSVGIKKSTVRKDNIYEVASESEMRKNNWMEPSHEPLAKDIIRGRAIEKLSETSYNIFVDNCEHFVNYCRYDNRRSRQIEKLKTVPGLVTAFVKMYYYMGLEFCCLAGKSISSLFKCCQQISKFA